MEAFPDNLYDHYGIDHAKFEMKGNEKMAYLSPFWEGTFSYILMVDRSFDEGEGHKRSWKIEVDAQFNLILTMTDPYLNPFYFTSESLPGTMKIQYNYIYNYPGGSNTCEGTSTENIEAVLAYLKIHPESSEYDFHFAFDNRTSHGGSPCIANCTEGYPHEVERSFYMTPMNWAYPPLPGHGKFGEDMIEGDWTGPPPDFSIVANIGTYDDCVVKWKFVKTVP